MSKYMQKALVYPLVAHVARSLWGLVVATGVSAQTEPVGMPALPAPAGSVFAQLATEAGGALPASTIKRLSLRTEMGPWKVTEALTYQRRADGLWEVARQTSLGSTTTTERMLTVRGLLPLAEVVRTVLAPTTPPGAMFQILQAPAMTIDVEAVANEAEGDWSVMLAPHEAGSFSARTAMSVQVSRSGGRSAKRSTEHAARQTEAVCTVAGAKPAASMHPDLRGNYLPVSCTMTVNAKTTTREFAYLVQSNLYVQLSQTDPVVSNFSSTSVVASVEYAP